MNSNGTPKQPITFVDPLKDSYEKLQRAEKLRLSGQPEKSGAICEALVRQYPDYFGALYTLGLSQVALKQFTQALGYLVRAAMLNPQSWRTLTALSAVYLELGATEMAAQTLGRAIRINPDNPNVLATLGEIYREDHEYELARDAYLKAFRIDPSLEAAALGLGSCCVQLGEYAFAAEALEGLLEKGIRTSGILSELANVPSSFRSVDMGAYLGKLHPEPGQSAESFRNAVDFVSATVLHEAGKHSKAWEHMVAANARMFKSVKEDATNLEKTQQANLEQLRTKTIRIAKATPDIPVSLFILGPSRSGKSTLESLVATMEGVKRGYENPSMDNAIVRTFQSAGLLTATLFEVLPENLNATCAENYIKELKARSGSAKVFTSTHPSRIHDAARIATTIPNARFVFVKRDPMDNILRIYMRKYLVGNYYAYDLKTIRSHIDWYNAMIDELQKKLPDLVQVVNYEDFVTEPHSVLADIAQLCGVGYRPSNLPVTGDDRGCANDYITWINSQMNRS